MEPPVVSDRLREMSSIYCVAATDLLRPAAASYLNKLAFAGDRPLPSF